MDPIADFLTSIRNANSKKLEKADVPFSKIKIELAKVLKEEGYIQSYRLMEEHSVPFLRIQLRYTEAKECVIQGIQRVSRPGLRVYGQAGKSGKVSGGFGISILSTSQGVMTHRKAKQINVGGEVLCHVW